jgi:hypothetical protein
LRDFVKRDIGLLDQRFVTFYSSQSILIVQTPDIAQDVEREYAYPANSRAAAQL